MGHLKRIGVMKITLLVFLSGSISSVVADHSPTHSRWSVEIGEDGETIESMMLTEQGTALIPVHIVNENLVSITISLNYTSPFDATVSGPESVTVEGSTDMKFEVIMRGVDIMHFEGGSEEPFEVTGTVTSRQGLPISVPGDSDSAEVEMIIPIIKRMALNLQGPTGQTDAGSEIILSTSLTNEGNTQEAPFNVQLTSSCAMMRLDIYLEGLDSRYEPQETKSRVVPIQIPQDNPTETCAISVEAIIYPEGDLSVKVVLNESVDVKIKQGVSGQQEDAVSEITDTLSAPSLVVGVIAFFASAYLRRPCIGSSRRACPQAKF